MTARTPPGLQSFAAVPGQVKQGEQEILHARDSVGQNSGATHWCPRPRFSDRIRNSRPTAAGTSSVRREPGDVDAAECTAIEREAGRLQQVV